MKFSWWTWGWRRSWRTHLLLAAIAGLALGLGLTGSMLERAFRHATARAAKGFDLVIGAPGGGADLVLATVFAQNAGTLPVLPGSVLAKLRGDERVAVATPLLLADRSGAFPIFGTDRSVGVLRPDLSLAAGRWFGDGMEAVAGAAVGFSMDHRFRGAHGDEHAEHAQAFRVCGVLKPTGTPWDRVVFVPIEALIEIHRDDAHEPRSELGLTAILVKPRSFSDAYKLRQDYRGHGTQALFPAETLVVLYTWMARAAAVVNSLNLAMQAMVLLLLCAILVAQFRGRVPFLALARTLGAPPWYLSIGLWLEGVSLMGLSVVFAILWTTGFSFTIAREIAGPTGLSLILGFGMPEARLVTIFIGLGALGSLGVLPWAYLASPRKWLR